MNEKNEKTAKRNKIIGISLGIIVVLCFVLVGTYAYWTLTRRQTDTNVVTASCLDFELEAYDDSVGISLQSAWPLSDEAGSNLTGYTFKVINKCNTDMDYSIGLEALETASANYLNFANLKVIIDNEKPRIYNNLLTLQNTPTEGEVVRMTKELSTNIVAANSFNKHTVKLYIDQDAPITEQGKGFKGKIVITGGQNIEQKKKTILLASVDVSETKSCSDYHRENCTDLNPNPNHVTAKMYSDGTITFGGTGAIAGHPVEISASQTTMIRLFRTFFTSDYFTSDEQALFEDNEVVSWFFCLSFLNYQEMVEMLGDDDTITNRSDFLDYCEENGMWPSNSMDLLESILIKLENIGCIGNHYKIIIEDGVTTIGEYSIRSFGGATIDSIEISDTVKTIKHRAFYGMSTNNLKLPNKLEIIGDSAFEHFYGPNIDLVIPDSVYELGNMDDAIFKSIKLPANPNVTQFSDYNGYVRIGTLYIPENITSVYVRSVDEVNAYGPQRGNLELHVSETAPAINWNYTD